MDEAQENLTNTLEKLSQAEKEADEASRSRKVRNIHIKLILYKNFCLIEPLENFCTPASDCP